jgi:uncharacterized membrane protein
VSRRRSAGALAVSFTLTGLLHFLRTRAYEAIMPPCLPAHRELVLISGAAEIAGGVGALSPRTRWFARWWLIALLIAIFPANVHMAMHPEQIRGLPKIPRWALWARLPFQAVFIAWAWYATSADE